jgi:hypothetical protein
VRGAEGGRRLGQGQLQHPIARRLGQLRRLARPGQVLERGQAVLVVAAPPGDHCRFGTADPLGDPLARHALAGQQHDPGPLDLPGRRALRPCPPLQLAPIGLRNLDRAHVSSHEEWSTRAGHGIKNRCDGALGQASSRRHPTRE